MTDLKKEVKIGKQGENHAVKIEFDISPFIAEFGNGTAQLLHQRSDDDVPYIATITQDGSTVTWNVSSDDTAYSGYGRGQLNYYVGGVIAKTVVFTTVCAESLTDETGTPAKVKSDLALIAETVENKLSPDNIIGGENVTIEIDGMNVIINSQGGGTTDYENLTNKPSVNGETLTGNKTSEALKITSATYYTPNSTVVNANTFDNGVYNIGARFTLTVGNEQIVIKKGAILAIKNTSSQTQGVILGNIDYGIVAFKYVQGFSTVVKNLKDMATETQVNAKQDTLTAGTGISIVNNVISATIGSALVFKGVKATTSQLPQSGNTIGDVWCVSADNSEWVWIDDNGIEKWEELGVTIDLSSYATKSYVDTEAAKKVSTAQGAVNANKALETDSSGNVVTKNKITNYKTVDALPQSDIDLNTGYLTKATRPTYNYGDYCSNKVQYPTEDIPPFGNISGYSGVSFVLYSEDDGCFYYINSSASPTSSYYRFDISGTKLRFGITNFKEANVFKYDSATSDTWASIGTPRPAYGWGMVALCDISALKKVKFVYAKSDFTYSLDNSSFTVSPTAAESATIINASYFATTGEYLGDLDNVDESEIYKFNNNVYNGITFDVLGQFDLQNVLDPFAKTTTVNTALAGKQNKPNKVILSDNSTVALADNTEYYGTNITALTFTYPQGDFECSMLLSFATSGTITVTLPTSSYIGEAPTFANSDTWELSIKNGIVVAGQVV